MGWITANIMSVIWVCFIVLAILVEANTMALVAIWFMPAAIIALIAALLGAPVYIQVIIFVFGSVLFTVFSRTIFKKTLRIKPVATNADALIGKKAVVTERISNISGTGAAKVEGKEWTARSYDGKIFEVGDIVNIISIEGVKLICNK